MTHLRRTLIGLPLPTAQGVHERLNKIQALAVLSSDALSSVAYATEEILLVLVLAGTMTASLVWPIALGIALLLAIVATSYYQTVHAYPNGGGAYTVSKENLGTMPSLIAGAALLTDYVLTVAVSISAGVAAITAAIPPLHTFRVEIALAAVLFVTLINLRGIKESGRVFALPTYFFIASIFLLIGTGLFKVIFQGVVPVVAVGELAPTISTELTLFLVLRAFASGCTAMTGVEAISNGVPIFHKPEADNAGKTLLWMAGILISTFIGITFLVHQYGILPLEGQTVISLLGRAVFGQNAFYYTLQAGTALILLLAANTSYSDFPRLAMWLAKDRYLPRQLTNLGDRLVYANGIVVLGALASLLIIAFRAQTHALIPLYAVGVFISFTLNQSGMVVHWFKLRTPGWQRGALINGVGAIATGVVGVIVAATKFVGGAWIVLLLIPALVVMFRAIHRHYDEVAEQLSLSKRWPTPIINHTVIVPIANLHRGVLKAVRYAQALSGDLHVVTIEVDPEATADLIARCQEVIPEITLDVLPSPYRSVIEPLSDLIDQYVQNEGDYVTVVLPEFVPAKWWHHLLHNQTAWGLKVALLYSRANWKGRFHIITDVPFYLEK